MKLYQSLVLFTAFVVGHCALARGTDTIAADVNVKQRYRVVVPKTVFDAALHQFGDELDVWRVAAATGDGPNAIEADVYATEASINKFYATPQSKALRTTEGTPLVQIERHPVNTQTLLQTRADAAAACTSRTARHLEETATTAYTQNAFFDCYRTADEIFAFFDQLVVENPTVFSKIDAISTTVEGRKIPAYKLARNSDTGTAKKAVYVQALAHAREWNSGTATYFTMASMLDGLRANNATITPVVDKYDWYFVPIVNLDGFLFTHSPAGDRYWRKNRRPTIGYQGKPEFGVDLNRNYGPQEFFNKANDTVWSLTYAGPSVLSEPETAGIFAFLQSLPLAGALDMHTFSYDGLVLRPFGNRKEEAAEPFGSKLARLGDAVKNATKVNNRYPYLSKTSAGLYLNYGNFIDAVFLQLNHTAALCYEVEGEDFVEPERVIRPGGQAVSQGIVQFAKSLDAYYSGL